MSIISEQELQRANQEQARARFVLVFLFSNLLFRLIDLHTEPTRSLTCFSIFR